MNYAQTAIRQLFGKNDTDEVEKYIAWLQTDRDERLTAFYRSAVEGSIMFKAFNDLIERRIRQKYDEMIEETRKTQRIPEDSGYWRIDEKIRG